MDKGVACQCNRSTLTEIFDWKITDYKLHSYRFEEGLGTIRHVQELMLYFFLRDFWSFALSALPALSPKAKPTELRANNTFTHFIATIDLACQEFSRSNA